MPRSKFFLISPGRTRVLRAPAAPPPPATAHHVLGAGPLEPPWTVITNDLTLSHTRHTRTTAPPLHTRFANVLGVPLFRTTMRPDPVGRARGLPGVGRLWRVRGKGALLAGGLAGWVALGLGRIVAWHHRSSILYPYFANTFGASISEGTMRPDPRSPCSPPCQRPAAAHPERPAAGLHDMHMGLYDPYGVI